MMNEQSLIETARNGDLDAFNRLVLAYQDIVFSQAYRMMGQFEAAEDATQKAFISAFRSLRSFRGGSFRAWLLRIVTNACYDEIRYQKRRPTTPLEPVDQSDEEMEDMPWMIDPSETPEETTMRAELNDAIQHCLEALPVEFRAVVILIDMNGLDYTEASIAIGKPVGTVKSRLARARFRMQGCLQGAWELLPARYRLVREAMQ